MKNVVNSPCSKGLESRVWSLRIALSEAEGERSKARYRKTGARCYCREIWYWRAVWLITLLFSRI